MGGCTFPVGFVSPENGLPTLTKITEERLREMVEPWAVVKKPRKKMKRGKTGKTK